MPVGTDRLPARSAPATTFCRAHEVTRSELPARRHTDTYSTVANVCIELDALRRRHLRAVYQEAT